MASDKTRTPEAISESKNRRARLTLNKKEYQKIVEAERAAQTKESTESKFGHLSQTTRFLLYSPTDLQIDQPL